MSETPAPNEPRQESPVRILSECLHDQIVVMQAAYIEWQHGNGAEAAMQWIANTLAGPGHIPDEDAPYGKEAQAWFDANNSHPMPTCACGRPSNQMQGGIGGCCNDHLQTALIAKAGAQ